MEKSKYRDIMFKGNYDSPLYIEDCTGSANKRIIITGEGGNRRIKISIDKGMISLPIDLHVYDGRHRAYIAPVEIGLTGDVSGKTMLRLMQQIQFRSAKMNPSFFWFTEDGLDALFDFIRDEF